MNGICPFVLFGMLLASSSFRPLHGPGLRLLLAGKAEIKMEGFCSADATFKAIRRG